MKNQIITTSLNGITESKNFINRIKNVLPTTVKEILIFDIGLKRGRRQSYEFHLSIDVNGKSIELVKGFDDAHTWDEWNDLEYGTVKRSNAYKRLVITLLEENQELLE